jgi:AraC-like DNA-binding protein
MASLVHKAEQHRSTVRGLEAITLVSNHYFPRHSHDQFGFGMIGFGAQRSWSAVGQVEALAGDVIFCNPGEVHDGTPVDGQVRGWRIIYFDPALINRAAQEEIGGELEIMRPVVRDPLLTKHFERLFASATDASRDPLEQEENLIHAIACILQRYASRRPRRDNARSPCVTMALQRLDAASDQTVSIAELAALAGASQFQLLRAFKRETGITPHAYLVQRRVSAARRLLAAGEVPAHAAVEAGFSDQSHMTRAFVRYLGVTPARYRAALAR